MVKKYLFPGISLEKHRRIGDVGIRTEKKNIIFNVGSGSNCAYSEYKFEDYFCLKNEYVREKDYRTTLSYISFEIDVNETTKMNTTITKLGVETDHCYFDSNTNINLNCIDYIYAYKSIGSRAVDKIIKKKSEKLRLKFDNCTISNGKIVIKATLHYLVLN